MQSLNYVSVDLAAQYQTGRNKTDDEINGGVTDDNTE